MPQGTRIASAMEDKTSGAGYGRNRAHTAAATVGVPRGRKASGKYGFGFKKKKKDPA